jgi:hypothetical protein
MPDGKFDKFMQAQQPAQQQGRFASFMEQPKQSPAPQPQPDSRDLVAVGHDTAPAKPPGDFTNINRVGRAMGYTKPRTPKAAPSQLPTPAEQAIPQVNQFMQGLGEFVAGVPQGAIEGIETLERMNPLTKIENAIFPSGPRATTLPLSSYTRPITRQAKEVVKETFPVDPNDQGWLTAKIPRAAGSVAGFAAGGLAGRALKAPHLLTMAGLGAASNIDELSLIHI